FISFHLYISVLTLFLSLLFFFTDPPPTEIYTLSLHDALPIYLGSPASGYRLTISTSPVRGPEVIFLKTNPLVLGISRSVRFSEGDPMKIKSLFFASSREKRLPRLTRICC